MVRVLPEDVLTEVLVRPFATPTDDSRVLDPVVVTLEFLVRPVETIRPLVFLLMPFVEVRVLKLSRLATRTLPLRPLL